MVVLGHTRCGAVTAAVELANSVASVAETTGCQHLHRILTDIQQEVDLLRHTELLLASHA